MVKPIEVIISVNSSATAKANHTPVIPNKIDITTAESIINTKPLAIDVAKAHLGKFVALNIPEPITFKPAKINPIEYNLKPTTAYFSSNKLFSLLNTPTIKSVNTKISKIIIAENNNEVMILSLLKILIPSLSPLP